MRNQRTSASAFVIMLALGLAQCSRGTSAPGAPPSNALWGDMKPLVSVKELMEYTIDPLSDGIFDAVGSDTEKGKYLDVQPKTDEDWEKVRAAAISLGEAIYLLKVPRPFTPAGDENVSRGPNPPELSPAQIEAKLKADPALWNAKIEALRNVMLEVLDVVKRRDTRALFDAGGDLDQACEGCHLEYWYPGEDKRREQRRLGGLEQLKKAP
jgi:cytochrome c556